MRSFGTCKWCGTWRELRPEQVEHWPTCLVCAAEDDEWNRLVCQEWEDAVARGEYDDIDSLADEFWQKGMF